MKPTSEQQLDALMGGTLPAVEEVRPGLYAIAFDMPGMQPPYAFSYAALAAEGSRDVHLIDAGLDTDENWEALGVALGRLGRQITDIASVTITHLHPDHTGLAWRIQEASGAVVRMHELEAATLRMSSTFRNVDRVEEELVRWGVPDVDRARLLTYAGTRAERSGSGVVNETVVDGDRINLGLFEGHVIHTPGHTSGHICIVIDLPEDGGRVVCTGDHVLPGINPGIALGGERAADPLGQYYASLEKLTEYSDAEVLPGHGFRFNGLGKRSAKIRSHHERRTSEVAAILAEYAEGAAPTIWEIASRVTWSNGWEGLQGHTLLSALAQVEMHVARVHATTV